MGMRGDTVINSFGKSGLCRNHVCILSIDKIDHIVQIVFTRHPDGLVAIAQNL